MAIVINGSGTVTGLAVGGLPDGTVDAGTVAADVATQAEIDAKLNLAGGTLTGNLLVADGANVGIGATPESWNTSLHALQIGETGSISGGDTAWGGYLEVGSNFYRDSGGFKRTSTDFACLAEFDNATGSIVFKSAASGSADAAISWTNQLQIKNDGRGLSQFTAKAWINYEQVGTQTITDSHNVGSVTDVSAGVGVINFANNVGNTGYSVSVNSTVGATYSSVSENINSTTTSSYRVEHRENASAQDADRMFSIVFGD